jgi:hypothetical protein
VDKSKIWLKTKALSGVQTLSRRTPRICQFAPLRIAIPMLRTARRALPIALAR